MDENLQKRCQEYQNSRTSPYWLRCIRYGVVATALNQMGLEPGDTIMDVGAGKQEFGPYLRRTINWNGLYVPVDGLLDGTDLNYWTPPFKVEFIVGIEIIEHVYDPIGLMLAMENMAIKGCVVTTPNPRTVDVLGCDPTHVSIIPLDHFRQIDWNVMETSLFQQPSDSLVGWVDTRGR